MFLFSSSTIKAKPQNFSFEGKRGQTLLRNRSCKSALSLKAHSLECRTKKFFPQFNNLSLYVKVRTC